MVQAIEAERMLESEEAVITTDSAYVVDEMERQIKYRSLPKESDQEEAKKAETNATVCNLFLKYLDRLYSTDQQNRLEVVQQELRTIESILLTELNATFEQTKKVEMLVKRYYAAKKSKSLWNKGQTIISYAAGMAKK
jgi:ribonuclease HI